MRTATVRDLRNNFKKIAAWIAAGEEVEITSRGKSVGRFVPNKPPTPWTPPSFESLMIQNRKIWEGEDRNEQTAEDFQKMLDYIRAEREF